MYLPDVTSGHVRSVRTEYRDVHAMDFSPVPIDTSQFWLKSVKNNSTSILILII